MTLLDNALSLAKHGIPVFPVGANKRPTTENGFHDASTDPATLARQFANPAATLIGVPTGAASGIDVLDLDPNSIPWHREHGGKLPKTRTHRTRRDGFHKLFRHREGVTCSAGAIADGVDIRGDGGYFVWWPAAGFEIYDKSPVAEMPEWLFDTIQAAGSKHKAAGEAIKNPDELAPPDACSVIELLRAMPNPESVTRDEYLAVCLAVQGTIRGGLALDRVTDEEADAIKDAAADWATRWEGPTPGDYEFERDRWDSDWSLRDKDLSGWPRLVGIASGLGMDVSKHEHALAAAEFGALDPEPMPKAVEHTPALGALTSIHAWVQLDIPEPDRLLGDLVTTTTRVFFVGRTGLGKTMFGLGLACGIASGAGFLHWPCARPAKVLYLDGEMPAELIKPRAIDALRRAGAPVPEGNLFIFGRDIELSARKACPELPPFEPLNLPGGGAFVAGLVKALGGVDLIVFDNVMSLLSGDQKDEVTWSGVNNLVQELSTRHIGQVWLDHTGHNSDRQYGSSTKGWKFDAIGAMAPVKDDNVRETAFTLSFEAPGKARRRTPDNWQQFEPRLIRLAGDAWSSEPVKADKAGEAAGQKLRPAAKAVYDALAMVYGLEGTATCDSWFQECVRQGLTDSSKPQRNAYRARRSELVAAGWVAINGDDVKPLRGFV